MSNTSCHMCTNKKSTSPNSSDDFSGQNLDSPVNALVFSTAVVIGLLSPLAIVGNALILATIWRRTFLRTSFHFVLSGLVVTDFLTGLISQPFYASFHLINTTNSAVIQDNPKVVNAIGFIAGLSTFLFVNVTVATMTLLSVERWSHMSRRSFLTSQRRYFASIVILVFPMPSLVVYILALSKPALWYTLFQITITNLSFCYLIISLAYFKVYKIVRRHQLQIQANGISQSFGQPAIDLAKYKKSVASMLYIFLLFSISFLPFAVSNAVVLITTHEDTLIALKLSTVFVYLSSSLNPVLYFWRMRDIRNGFKQLLASLRT
ncbi:neuromedin-U receptor 2-like [Stylophora pistillata]|uniref:neuromedin-U receptor 2-like n=1 Tax=Stylophora pistillata TaxID=50429 RepID=UPI000C03B5DE|nr:neuromedin-U receptor 2-like [Stylophora pistillata]